ncbi:MAG: VWA domain-containing protein [Candidatus Kapabacteria bacterium]|nr:VWA domain-containing protein [Candidatus Kapabacteria bacterium]
MNVNQNLRVLISAVTLLAFSVQFVVANGLDPVPTLNVSSAATASTVRDLVKLGQARYQVVDRRVFAERTEIELVLTDNKGNTIGGYAPPYLQSEEDARQLWKDFVSANLSMSAVPEQISIREQRRNESDAFAVAFALDHSPSMTIPRAIRMQKAIQQALSSFNGNDYVSVVKFTGRVTTEVELTKDRSEYLSEFKVNGLNLRSEGTAIYDAAVEGIKQLQDAPDATKRILIIFTDGEDNSSSSTNEEVITLAKKTGTIIHTVVYGAQNDAPVTRLSSETGGKNFRLNDVYEFDRIFLGIYKALRHSYVLTINTNSMERDLESSAGGVLTAAGNSAGSIHTNEMMVLLPRNNVEISKLSTEDALVMNINISFDAENGEVNPSDMGLLDSMATVMVQRNDVGLDIVSASSARSSSHEEIEMSQKRVRSIRDILIRRGINPSRIQSYANRSASSNPLLQRVASETKTTFVFTKL